MNCKEAFPILCNREGGDHPRSKSDTTGSILLPYSFSLKLIIITKLITLTNNVLFALKSFKQVHFDMTGIIKLNVFFNYFTFKRFSSRLISGLFSFALFILATNTNHLMLVTPGTERSLKRP